MQEPINQHHTAVAGPPDANGEPKVAGTEPRTPRMEMAYETVDHLENSRRSSYNKDDVRLCVFYDRFRLPLAAIPVYIQCVRAAAHRHLESSPWQGVATDAQSGLPWICDLDRGSLLLGP